MAESKCELDADYVMDAFEAEGEGPEQAEANGRESDREKSREEETSDGDLFGEMEIAQAELSQAKEDLAEEEKQPSGRRTEARGEASPREKAQRMNTPPNEDMREVCRSREEPAGARIGTQERHSISGSRGSERHLEGKSASSASVTSSSSSGAPSKASTFARKPGIRARPAKAAEQGSAATVVFSESDMQELAGLSYDTIMAMIRREKKVNKAAEDDIALLLNRIQHLRHESNLTLKKTAETNTRIEEIRQQRNIRFKRSEEQVKRRESRESSIESDVERNKRLREEGRKRRQEAVSSVVDVRRSLTMQSLEERERNREEKRKIEEQILKEKEERRARRLEEVQKKKLQEERLENERQRKIKEQKARELLRQSDICKAKAEGIRQLEEMEMQLIRKLKEAQLSQHGAYVELEKALREPVEESKEPAV